MCHIVRNISISLSFFFIFHFLFPPHSSVTYFLLSIFVLTARTCLFVFSLFHFFFFFIFLLSFVFFLFSSLSFSPSPERHHSLRAFLHCLVQNFLNIFFSSLFLFYDLGRWCLSMPVVCCGGGGGVGGGGVFVVVAAAVAFIFFSFFFFLSVPFLTFNTILPAVNAFLWGAKLTPHLCHSVH